MIAPSGSRYILLAEDNPADVHLVREVLEDKALGYDLKVVSDGEQAVELIARIDRDSTLICPALLLLDLHLPKMDGEEILRCLRSSERCGLTPVVIMTSSDAPRDEEMATRNAALHYFRKPSTLEHYMKLGDVVEDIIARNTKY
jgi:chemotaxis family two-component system response regulator Rcp1